jgi:uncharacterized membrane protein (UPF0182 family)
MLLLLAIVTIIIIGVLGFASLHLLDVVTFTSADYLLLLLVLVIIQVLLKGFVNNHVIEDEPNSKAPPAV